MTVQPKFGVFLLFNITFRFALRKIHPIIIYKKNKTTKTKQNK